MINPKELRVGNIIGWRTGFGELITGPVYEVHNDKVAISPVTRDGEEAWQGFMKVEGIEPIPITSALLDRCGFIGLTHLGKKEYSLEIDDELTIEACFYDHLTIRLVITNSNDDENIDLGEFVTYRNIPDCKHLHQLQNLHLSLTGEELKLKAL